MASRAKRIDKKGVCNWVQDIIKARRISIGEFCKLGGVGRTDASAFMSYRKYPTRKQVESICAAFGEDPQDILCKYNYKTATAAKETVEEESAVDIVTNVDVETKVDEPKKYDSARIQKNVLTRAGFSRWLEREVSERKLSSHTLAKNTGASQSQICKYIRGTGYPEINTLDKLCVYFGYNTISVACVFKYQRFEEPSTWLGENYGEDDDYRKVYSMAFPREKKKAESTQRLESLAAKLDKEDVDSRTDLSPISTYSEEKTNEVLERASENLTAKFENQGYFTSEDVAEELGLKPNLVSNFLSKKPVGPVEAKIKSVAVNKLPNPVDVFIDCVVAGLKREVKGSVSGYYEDSDVVFKITAPGLPDIQKRISFNVESVVDDILSNYRDAVMAAYFKEV